MVTYTLFHGHCAASDVSECNSGKDSADMDPFVAITYDGCPYRTRVIRNELNPEWSERIILYDREIPGRRTAKKIKFSVMDWERLNSDAHVGDASLDLSELMGFIPTQDPVTGLFPEGNHDRSLRTFKIPLIPDEGVTYDTKPVLEIRYNPSLCKNSIIADSHSAFQRVL
jgi:phosphatidylserine decarboxylase